MNIALRYKQSVIITVSILVDYRLYHKVNSSQLLIATTFSLLDFLQVGSLNRYGKKHNGHYSP